MKAGNAEKDVVGCEHPIDASLSSPVSSGQSPAVCHRYMASSAALMGPNVGGTAEDVLSSLLWDGGFFYFPNPPKHCNITPILKWRKQYHENSFE